MGEAIKKDSVYAVMGLIYKVLKKQEVVTDTFIERTIHVDASTQEKADQLGEEEKLAWYMVMILYKMVFDEAGNYYKYKEQDPEKWAFLNEKRPFYQSMNRVDLTRSYIFEKAITELKEMNFQDLEQKTGVLLDPKRFGNAVRSDIMRRNQEF